MSVGLRKKKILAAKFGSGAVHVPFNGLVSTANLVSYWTLDEASGTRLDSFGTNHLTPTNNPVGAAGKIGNGCDLESTNSQYLSYADATPLGNEDWTWTLWFKRESVNVFHLVGKDAASGRSYTLYCDAATITFSLATVTSIATPLAADLTWHFVTFWHDAAANTINIQLDNGAVASTTTNNFSPNVTSTPVAIGARTYVGFEEYFDGLIDEVGLWRRVLTPTERTALYNSGNGLAF